MPPEGPRPPAETFLAISAYGLQSNGAVTGDQPLSGSGPGPDAHVARQRSVTPTGCRSSDCMTSAGTFASRCARRCVRALLAAGPSRLHRIAYESLKCHALVRSSLFPTDLEFLRAFNREYVDDVRLPDSVGMGGDRLDLEEGVVAYYGLTSWFTRYINQDRA